MTQPNNSEKIKVGDLVRLWAQEQLLGLVVLYVEEYDTYRVYLFKHQRVVRGFYRDQFELLNR